MKNAQTITYVIALAAVLAIYDILKEWLNFSTVVALIVVLSLFGAWLIVQIILNKFLLDKSDKVKIVTEPKPISKMDLNRVKRILLLLKPRRTPQQKNAHVLTTEKEQKPKAAPAKFQPGHDSARARVQGIVTNLCNVPGITAAAIVSTDGVIFVAAPEEAISSYRAATVTGSMFALGNRIVEEFGRNNLEQIMVRGEDGEVFFHRVAKEAFIMVLVNKGFQMGHVVREMQEAAENAATLMVA
jgi:predicted regulator of Ras-like GTPase activity (Roadblock/LC7/MglB family)